MKIIITFISIFFIFNLTQAQVSVVDAFPNLTFSRPVDLQHAPDGSDRIFVVSQNGDIDVFSTADSTISETKLFMSLQDSVRRNGSEEGLLGLTFHPDYIDNGYLYVSYNPAGTLGSVIARYKVSADPDKVDQSTKKIILQLSQPAGNHNGGQIAFGPDGYLYFGLGDGGGSNDQYGNGQNLETMLGSIIRIDVDDTSSYGNYAIPPDNPFVGNDSSWREEIYAYGLRNPWRWSFDPLTGWLWLGDVGQGTWEEIDIIEKGGNYGWSLMEGAHCFPIGSDCDDTGLIYPIAEYNHNFGIAVTGGYVYRGSKVPDLYGKYVYGDYGSGLIWTIDYDGTADPVNELLLSSGRVISTFGVDTDYELYICDLGGKIYKFYQPPVAEPDTLLAPLLISPPDNATDVSRDTVGFNWHTVENAESYMLEVASDNEFTTDYFYLSSSDTSARVPIFAGDGVDFFWRVRAGNTQDSSQWSETWKFTTIVSGIPNSPQLISPLNNVKNVPVDTVNFYWHNVNDAESFILEGSSDNGFIADYFYVSTTDTFTSVILNAAQGMDYYWHVRAINNTDSSAWSSTWKFTTISPAIPNTPMLISPVNNASDVPADTADFSWHSVNNAENYFLEVSSDNSFVADYFSVSATDTFASIILYSPAGMDYFWHVRASNSTDTSEWSETWKFTTEQANAFDDETLKPATFHLLQNRPNPFNPVTLISYQLASNSFVSLKVFDLTGKEIQTMVNQQQSAGNYSVSFDASTLPSGIYFYRLITSNGFAQSRKMILLK